MPVEVLNNTESGEWESTTSLRPHRLFENHLTVDALLNRRNYDFRSGTMFIFEHGVESYIYPNGYSRDLVGKGLKGMRDFMRGERLAREILRNLTDDSVIHLDVQRDLTCQSCIIGKHCLATNLLGQKEDPLTYESKHVNKIHEILLSQGSIEGEDFIFKTTFPILYDFEGRELGQNDSPKPEAYNSFRSLLVKTGALRKVARVIRSHKVA